MSKNWWTSGKQSRPWWDVVFCSISSGYSLFAQSCLSNTCTYGNYSTFLVFLHKHELCFNMKKKDTKSFQPKKHQQQNITKTCLYNVDPLKPHFYIVKVGFTGIYIIFLVSAQNIDCGYSLELPRWGGSNEYLQSMFLSRNKKNIRIFIWKFSIFWL